MLVRDIGPSLSCLIDWLVGFDMRACCYYIKKNTRLGWWLVRRSVLRCHISFAI